MWKNDFPVEKRYYEAEDGILYCGDDDFSYREEEFIKVRF